MPQYRSLVGGYFATPDKDRLLPASIRYNNPGAINGNAPWVREFPGFVATQVIGGGNPIAIMETPEQGVALWYELMRRYQTDGHRTVNQIITHYGGGQDYSKYVTTVALWAEMHADEVLPLEDDDDCLLRFARAMFRYEAGRISPLSDAQIKYGFALARDEDDDEPPEPLERKSIWQIIADLLTLIFGLLFGCKPLDPAPHLTIMRKITGTKEAPGPADNPAILAWPKFIGQKFPDMAEYCRGYTHDSIPWCGLCVAYALAAAGLRPVFGKTDTARFLWAAAWAKEGPELVRLDPEKLFPGAILVFTRQGGGHVALYEGEDDTHYHIRGGNQSDMVNVVRKPKAALTAATWPRALPIPKDAGPVRMDINHNPVSEKED